MSRRASMASFATGLMAGLMAGEQKKFEREQQAQDRAFLNQQRTRQQEQWGREDALRSDLADAAAPKSVTSGQLAGPMQDGQDHQEVFKADGQAFGTKDEAETVAARANLPSMRMQRTGDALAKHGQVDQAQRYYDFARQAREEGVGELLSAIKSTAPDIEAIRGTKAGFVSREIPAEALAAYDGQGKWRVQKGSMVQSYLTKDDFGNETLDHRVVRPDGSVIVDSVNLAERFLGAKPGAQAEHNDQRARTRYAIDKDNRDFELRKSEMDSRQELRAAQADAAEARARGARMGGGGGNSDGATKPGTFWTPKDDDKLEAAYTRKDELTGASDFDATGFQFAKRLALAASQQNGGDTATARAWAYEQDRKLQRMANGDRDKLNQLRAQHLQAASQPPQAAQPAPQPAPQAAAQPAPRPAQPVPQPAPQADPMANVPQAQALDAARKAKAQAYQNLLKYGSVQRQRDPQGFAAAKAAYEQASAQADAAASAWEQYAANLQAKR